MSSMTTGVMVQLLIGGLLLGGIYALVAFGLSLIYGVARILNVAHGTLLAITGVLASLLYEATQWNPAIIAAILVPLIFLFGYAFHATLLRPLGRRNKSEEIIGTVLVTTGALIIMSDVAGVAAGTAQRNIAIASGILELGDEVILPVTQAWILAGIGALTIVLQLVLRRSWFGRAVRAVTQDSVGAAICGVNSSRAHTLTFAAGSGIVAIAGVLYVLNYPVDPYMGFGLTVKAFTIIVVGGIGNLGGALLTGILLGVGETFTAFLWAPQWAPAISVVLLLVILVVYPEGLANWRRS